MKGKEKISCCFFRGILRKKTFSVCAGMWISSLRKILIVPGRAASMSGISAQLGSTGFVLRVYVEHFLSARDADVTLSQYETQSACVCR